jgi:hypothetical protein
MATGGGFIQRGIGTIAGAKGFVNTPPPAAHDNDKAHVQMAMWLQWWRRSCEDYGAKGGSRSGGRGHAGGCMGGLAAGTARPGLLLIGGIWWRSGNILLCSTISGAGAGSGLAAPGHLSRLAESRLRPTPATLPGGRSHGARPDVSQSYQIILSIEFYIYSIERNYTLFSPCCQEIATPLA